MGATIESSAGGPPSGTALASGGFPNTDVPLIGQIRFGWVPIVLTAGRSIDHYS